MQDKKDKTRGDKIVACHATTNVRRVRANGVGIPGKAPSEIRGHTECPRVLCKRDGVAEKRVEDKGVRGEAKMRKHSLLRADAMQHI